MEWTKEQKEAIEYSGKNILLAAAAGSGKTAVLVQRIIELIKNHGVSVNQLLVLTFTDAAAGEMREKIKRAVNAALRDDPHNPHLLKQRLLMHSACISTVHSFCSNVIKSNIHLTDLPVDYTMASEIENSIMLKESLDRVLEHFYSRIDKDKSFADLVMGYGGIKNDNTLRETVLDIYNFSCSMAYPAKWLNEAVRPYKQTALEGKLPEGWWTERLAKLTEIVKNQIFDAYGQIENEIEKVLTPKHPYGLFFEDEFENIKRVFAHTGDYSETKAALESFAFSRMKPGVRNGDEAVIQAQDRVKALRDTVKKSFSRLQGYFAFDLEMVCSRIAATYPQLRTLKNIVLMVDRQFTKRKRAENYLDFNDLEHQMLKLLTDNRGEPSELALKLRERFHSILVDEYQDTNNIQDTIFRILSKDNRNIFMVGDLKQSIYKFRNAVPKLFSDKYNLYGAEEDSGHLIRLFKNFRSRETVVDTVNFVFRCIMSPYVGDIDYTKEEYLIRGAEYPQPSAMADTEFHMICRNSTDENGESVELFQGSELEARLAAGRIRQLVESGVLVYDKEIDGMRPIRYRDIVILMRSPRKLSPVFETIFEEWGVPLYTEMGHSYLDSIEIMTVIAYLQIIDNPRQDIPLIAVMRSPMWGFEPDELAEIRSYKPEGCFFDAATLYPKENSPKLREFLDELELLRDIAENSGVDKLIYRIYYNYGYYLCVGSMKSGKERQANLRVLLERAREFEHTKMSGLFSFINYIETIRSEDADLTPAKAFGEGEDVVRIMSIHKSKGLEFPVVILADTAHRFNLTDSASSIIRDEQGGIGATYVDTRLRVRYPTLAHTLVAQKLNQDMISEEMRLLYVALTRAREKLIILSTYRMEEKSWKNPVWFEDGRASAAYVAEARSYRDWLVAAVMRHRDAGELRAYCEIAESVVDRAAEFGMKTVMHYNPEGEEFCVPMDEDFEGAEINIESSEYEEIEERLGYVYPEGEFADLPVKLSVSEVKRMQQEEGEYVPLIESLKTEDMAALEEVTGAKRGTVVHFVMQMIDPRIAHRVDAVEEFVNNLVRDKVLTEAQGTAVDCECVARFFASEMGQRMCKAVRRETEFSFYTYAAAEDVLGRGGDRKILLQGTMDCFFVEEDGTIVLMDYKTDRVTNAYAAKNAAKRYEVQMRYYKQALSEILRKPVKRCYLYFLECGELVEM